MLFAIGIDTVHLQMAVTIRIGVPKLVDIIAVAFAGTLTEVKGSQFLIGIAQQGVAHDEHVVEFVVAARYQTATKGLLPLILRLDG